MTISHTSDHAYFVPWLHTHIHTHKVKAYGSHYTAIAAQCTNTGAPILGGPTQTLEPCETYPPAGGLTDRGLGTHGSTTTSLLDETRTVEQLLSHLLLGTHWVFMLQLGELTPGPHLAAG